MKDVDYIEGYDQILADIVNILDLARRSAARSVNAVMTATYWMIGYRIVELEQRGSRKADYGKALIRRMSKDLIAKFGRGFSRRNLEFMRLFYLSYPIARTVSAQLKTDSIQQHLLNLNLKLIDIL